MQESMKLRQKDLSGAEMNKFSMFKNDAQKLKEKMHNLEVLEENFKKCMPEYIQDSLFQ